jgi:hypothetical protein
MVQMSPLVLTMAVSKLADVLYLSVLNYQNIPYFGRLAGCEHK